MYVIVPFVLTTALPLAGAVTIATVLGSTVPSGSKSLPSTLIVTALSDWVWAESLTATGGALTKTVTVAVLDTAPRLSLTV